MGKEVRNIFMILVGTVVAIVIISMITELLNISIYGIQLQQITKMACEKSLTLFTQESYKQRTDETTSLIGGSINMPDIADAYGNSYVSGQFYSGDTVEDIYNSLYSADHKPDFSEWVKDRESDGNWQSINLLNQYLNGTFPITTLPNLQNYLNSTSDIDAAYEKYEEDIAKYSTYATAKGYVDTYMTPLNFGVPYMDEETVIKMFKWNLTQLLSNCNSSMIRQDDSGKSCITVNGFRVYADAATITNIEYQVFDLTDSSDRDDFMQLTNLDPDNLGFSEDVTYLGTSDDERQRICVIGVEYSVPISYTGITPIKSIFNYVWNTEVNGWNDKQNRDTATQQFESTISDMTGGGFDGYSIPGVLPVPGKLIYYLVR